MNTPFGSKWTIPKEWKLVSLQEVTSDWRGGAPFEPEDFTAQGFPVLHKGGIHRGGKIVIDAKKKTFTTQDYAQSHQKSVIDRAYMAATLRDLVPSGPSIGLMADLAESPTEKYILAQGAYGFRIDASQVKPAYLVWLSNYEPFREYIKRYCVGSTQIHIRTPVFQELKIPLPPISEQKRIAAILDKAEELRSLRRQALGEVDAMTQSIFLEMFGNLNLPERSVGDLISSGSLLLHKDGNHGSLYPRSGDFDEEGIPFLSAKCVTDDGLIDPNLIEYLREEKAKKLKIGWITKGDVLLAHNASVGKVAFYNGHDRALIGTSLTAFRPNPETLDSLYLAAAFRSTKFQQQLMKNMGQTTRNQVPITAQRELRIVEPPLSLQQEFARRVEAIEQLKATHRESLAHLDALFASLQHRAFRGEL